jgi:hypothetical protein
MAHDGVYCVLKCEVSFRNRFLDPRSELARHPSKSGLRQRLQGGPPLAKERVVVEIHHSDRDHVDDDRTRADPQCRAFDAFRSVASEIQAVEVALRRERRAGSPHRVTCTVRAEIDDGDHIAVIATGDWVYVAPQEDATRAGHQLDPTLTSWTTS